MCVLALESRRKGSDTLPYSEVLVVKRKDEFQIVIPVGWRQEGHPATETLLQFLFFHGYLWMTTTDVWLSSQKLECWTCEQQVCG